MSCTNCSSGSSQSFDMQCFFNNSCFGCSDNECGNNVQNARCIIYTGPNLPCAGVETNDSVELALQKIDEQICSILGDYSTYQFHCLEDSFGDVITTEADFVDAITDFTCDLKSDFDVFVETTFEDYKSLVNARFISIEQPGITCVSAGVTSSNSLIQVLNKYCEKFEDIDEEISLDGVDWDQCLTVTTPPTNISDAFSLLVDMICQIQGGEEIPTSFNNSGSCISGGTSDSLATTISLIKTRLCQTPTFDKDNILWSCLTAPSFTTDQDITAALQEIINLIVDIKTALPTFDSGDFDVTQTNISNACDGVTVSLQTTSDIDRFVAVSAGDASPGTLIDKLEAGTGIDITNNADTTIVITNTDPDQVVILNEGTGITITGTYPEFTISSAASTDTNFAINDLTFTGNRLHNLTGFTCTLSAGTVIMDVSRFQMDKGGDVTSSNNLTVGGDGNLFVVTGNTQINALTTSNWQAGSVVILEFSGAPTVKHNTAGGAGTAPFFLAGGVDFVAAVGDSLTVYYNGTHWHEQTRQVAASMTSTIYRNGLTESPAGIVEWGGTLLHDTTITSGTFKSIFTGSSTSETLRSVNTSSGSGIYTSSNTGVALLGESNAISALLRSASVLTGSRQEVLSLIHNSSNVPLSGFGLDVNLYLKSATVNERLSTQFSTKWTDPIDVSRTSQFDLTGVSAGVNNLIMSAHGSGVVGIGIDNAYSATRLQVVDNTLAGASMVKLTTTSTAAASGNQRMLDIAMSGTNATSNQSTYGIYVSNTHTGTNPTNYGIRVNVTSGHAVYGTTDTGFGVTGISTSSIGVNGQSTSNAGVNGTSTDGYGGTFSASPASFNSVINVAKFLRATAGNGGAGANGVGGALDLQTVSDSTTSNQKTAGRVIWRFTTATDTAETSEMRLATRLAGSEVDSLTLAGDGSVKLRNITATAASAITPSNGMLVYVSDTDGTFTSVGFWGRENGVWIKL